MGTLRGLLAAINDPANSQGLLNFGLNTLAQSGYSATPRTFGEIVANSMLQSQQMAAKAAQEKMQQQMMQAQLEALQRKDAPKLVSVMGPNGRPIYETADKAAGMEVPQEPRGSTADPAMIAEWKASGEPDYWKFMQRRARIVNPITPPQEPLVPVQNADGSSVLVPRSQAAYRAPAAPREVALPAEGERVAANYFARMEAAERSLGDYQPSTKDYVASDKVMSGSPLMAVAANSFVSPEGQVYYQAAADWVRAKLRKESGAVIPPSEMAQEIKTYFPLPTDDKETVRKKKAARLQAMAGMKQMAGRAQVMGIPPGPRPSGVSGIAGIDFPMPQETPSENDPLGIRK